MKKIISFLVLFGTIFLACEREEVSNANTSNTNNSIDNSITYKVNGVEEEVSEYTFNFISEEGGVSFVINNGISSLDSSITLNLSLLGVDYEVGNYPIISGSDINQEGWMNKISYSKGSAYNNSGIWSNELCDTLFTNTIPENGYFNITEINETDKKISGTFEKVICNSDTNMLVEGTFEDVIFVIAY